MIIRPELQALRSNDAPQRHAQTRLGEVLKAWKSAPEGATADAELAHFFRGTPLEDLPLLSALFTTEESAAARFCNRLVAVIVAELDARPLGQSPLRHFTDETLTTISIARHGTATLCLQVIDGAGLARRPETESASFSPSETWEHVLAGEATAEQIRIVGRRDRGAELRCESRGLSAGQVLHRMGCREALVLRRVPATLVSLKLQRRTRDDAVTRQYRLRDGELIHQASGNARDSRLELSAALLGRMGRRDAAPMLAAMAEEQGSAGLRWQVLRECLALDSAVGFTALSRIARKSDDPLAVSAGALRVQLLETHPALAEFDQCRG